VLLAELELDVQTTLSSHPHDLGWTLTQLSKSFAALDSVDAYVYAQVEVRGEPTLCSGDLERSATRNGLNTMVARGGYFATRDVLIRDEPASHR
jgi:hypothetical protein